MQKKNNNLYTRSVFKDLKSVRKILIVKKNAPQWWGRHLFPRGTINPPSLNLTNPRKLTADVANGAPTLLCALLTGLSHYCLKFVQADSGQVICQNTKL